MSREVSTTFYLLLFIALIVGNVSVYRDIFAPAILTVTVFDVGKGDATLLQTPEGKSYLIDAGPDASILRALGSALPIWQRRIDAIILTSTKKSFAGGLPDVQNRYHVARTFSSGEQFTLDHSILLNIDSPGIFSVSYGRTLLKISSTTPKGVYVSDGKTFVKN